MQSATWPEAGDTVGGGGFKGRAAILCPDGAGHEAGGVGEEIGHSVGRGTEGVDAFRLVTINEFEDVFNLAFCGRSRKCGSARDLLHHLHLLWCENLPIIGITEPAATGEYGPRHMQ